MKTKESINTENYYYYQVFFDKNYTTLTGVCFAESSKEAEEKINEMIKEKEIKSERIEICLYYKNYKIESRKMVEAGNYLE